MSDQEQPTEEKQTPLSKEEIRAMREKMLAYWEEQVPFLNKQLEFEMVTADIEEARARRLEMSLRYAQMAAATQGSPNEESPKRKLRTEQE